MRPRDVAKQRELLINQNGRSEAVSVCLRRSAVWGAANWGTEGRRFKSSQPDKETAGRMVFVWAAGFASVGHVTPDVTFWVVDVPNMWWPIRFIAPTLASGIHAAYFDKVKATS